MTAASPIRSSRRAPSRKSSPHRRPWRRLWCERLEDRTVPATIAWDGGPDGTGDGNGTNWLDRFNWVGDQLPETGHDVTIGSTGSNPTIVLGGPAAVNSVVSSRAISVSGSLTINGTAAEFQSLSLSGTLTTPALISVTGSLALNGSLVGGGGLTLAVGGVGSVDAEIDGPLVNQGQLTVYSIRQLNAAAAVTNAAGATMTLSGNIDDGLGYRADANNPAFTNYGQVFVTTGQPYFAYQVNAPVVNAPGGTITVQLGALTLPRGLTNAGTVTGPVPAATLRLTGPVANAGGSIAVGRVEFRGPAVTIDGGSFQADALADQLPGSYGAAVSFTGGTAVTLTGASIHSVGSLDLTGAALTTPGTLTLSDLDNRGTITAPATNLVVTGSLFVRGALLGGGGLTLAATGSGVIDSSDIDGPLVNRGQLTVRSGQRLLNATASVTNAAGATMTLFGNYGLGLETDAYNPTFTNYGTVFVNASQPYYSFDLNAPVVNAPGGTITVQLGSFRFPRGIINAAGATFDDRVDATLGGFAGVCIPFVNAGLFVKSGGGGTTTLYAQLINSGTVRVDSGQLTVTCGYVVPAGSSGSASGSIDATVTNDGQVTATPSPNPPLVVSGYSQSAFGSLIEQIGGYVAGTQYGQIVVTGDVTLDGTLQVRRINGFTPQLQDRFIVIENRGSNPISGAFTGLPEGALVFDGSYGFTVSYRGGTGNDLVLTLTVNNQPPSNIMLNGGSVAEGSTFTLTGSFSDPNASDVHTVTVTWGPGEGSSTLTLPVGQRTFTLSHLYRDDNPTGTPSDVYPIGVTISDGTETGSAGTTVTVNNVPPAVGAIAAPIDPFQVGTSISTSATFADAGTLDTHTASWDWGDGTNSAGVVTATNASGSVTGSHTYTTPGVYMVTLTVTDDDTGSDSEEFRYVVAYDPSAGFVTGGGWINSPAGAYVANPALTGRANFGFVSRYQNRNTVPTGNTEFQFKVANFNFKSTAYEWLVVSGAKARYRGTGTVNGAGSYGFELTAWDGQVNGGGGVDRFRIKIWLGNQGNGVVYDNMMNAPDGADPTTALGGGSIVIHKQGSPLLAAGGSVSGSMARHLSPADLKPILLAAIDRWAATGLDAQRLDIMRHATVTIENLGGSYLGLADPVTHGIRIDDDAAGHGWFVDMTPMDDSEFRKPGKGVRDRMDLVSVVAHELGHIAGLDHDGDAKDVMGDALATGTRRIPTAGDVKGVVPVMGVRHRSARRR